MSNGCRTSRGRSFRLTAATAAFIASALVFSVFFSGCDGSGTDAAATDNLPSTTDPALIEITTAPAASIPASTADAASGLPAASVPATPVTTTDVPVVTSLPTPTPTPVPVATSVPPVTPTPKPPSTPTPKPPSTPTPKPPSTPTPEPGDYPALQIAPDRVFRYTRKQTAPALPEGRFCVVFEPGADVYFTKKDFAEAFLSDLYSYLVIRLGGAPVAGGKVYTRESFLAFLQSEAAEKKNFEPLTNALCPYLLTKDRGGEFGHQIFRKGFFGYCMAYNRYEDFVYYMKDAFYWWRNDEGYGRGDPEKAAIGRDILADPWASFADMCKILRHDEKSVLKYFSKSTTLYKMICAFPCVATPSGALPESYDPASGLRLNVSLSRHGYTFTGWYTDPECRGMPVTEIPAGPQGDVTLYAGWRPGR